MFSVSRRQFVKAPISPLQGEEIKIVKREKWLKATQFPWELLNGDVGVTEVNMNFGKLILCIFALILCFYCAF